MNIRVATLKDTEAIRAVGVASWHDTYTAIVPEGYIAWALAKWWSPEAIQRQILSEQFIVLVAEQDGTIVGIAHAQIRSEQEATLWRLYVTQARRGQGIGSALIAQLEQQLPLDTHTLYVEYYEQNHRAATFYAKQGFVFDHREHEIFAGESLISVFVKRTVRPRYLP